MKKKLGRPKKSTSIILKDRELLLFICDELAFNQICPSFQEMADKLKLSGRPHAGKVVSRLVKGGYLAREKGKPRAIAVTPKGFEFYAKTHPERAKHHARAPQDVEPYQVCINCEERRPGYDSVKGYICLEVRS